MALARIWSIAQEIGVLPLLLPLVLVLVLVLVLLRRQKSNAGGGGFLCPFYLQLNAKGVNRFFIITQKGTRYVLT